MKESEYKGSKVCVSGGRCVFQLVYIFIWTYIVLVPYMWASMTFLPFLRTGKVL